MSNTPRTDSATLVGHGIDRETTAQYVTADFARQLERERSAARTALQHIVYLSESDDGLTAWDAGNIAHAALTASK